MRLDPAFAKVDQLGDELDVEPVVFQSSADLQLECDVERCEHARPVDR
ncbi:MAG: hypothetical protein HKN07_08170 [Acidimicrobiia bacterium]|nr:hypothetical protein [Acidimicrobiia bacterium]